MSTLIRPEVSKKNEYHISKHRYYELKHLCLQYLELKKEYNTILTREADGIYERLSKTNNIHSDTEDFAILKASLAKRITAIEEAIKETDDYFQNYILMSVTQGLSYSALKARYDIPCCRSVWYKIYRRFFFILNRNRD